MPARISDIPAQRPRDRQQVRMTASVIRLKKPETFLFPSLLPMIPGIYAYKAFGGLAMCISASSCFICCDSVLCVMKSSLAASEKFRVSATFTKYFNWRSSIIAGAKLQIIRVSCGTERDMFEHEYRHCGSYDHCQYYKHASEAVVGKKVEIMHEVRFVFMQKVITQSTLSQQIKQLEAEINAQLLQRNSHGVALTEAGAELLPYARRTICDAEMCRQRMFDLQDLLTGTLNIGVTYSFAPILTESIFTFMKQYPGVKLNVFYKPMAELMDMLRRRQVDFVLAMRIFSSHGLRSSSVSRAFRACSPFDGRARL